MYQVLPVTVQNGSPFPLPGALQATEGSLPFWMIIIVVSSVLFGVGVAVRRTRITSGEPPTRDPRPTLEPPRSEPAALTNEEQVIQLLRSNGGRMRQTRIVGETDWSKSKVSMLLSDMEADGTINKLRVGRENIISLPGAEPEAALSSLEEQ